MRMRFGILFWGYIKYHKKSFYLLFICSFIFGTVFYLNSIPADSVLYALLLCLFVFVLFVAADFIGFARKHDKLYRMQKEITLGISNLPLPENLIEEDYWELLRISHADKIKLLSAADNEKSEGLEYYTMWVHQIKTPIAAMRLILQSEPGVQNSEMDAELFKIEQYVEMVLTYIRLGCNGNDFVIKHYELSGIVKPAIRKYAKLFIKKKISISLEDLDYSVLTDAKWLSFVIEQILSNALKYTKKGSIRIAMEKDNLVIEDTGIGISEEDLPRVFEKGYTGYNGRSNRKSTGIGLYLCKRIITKLGHTIDISSVEGQGTKVRINLTERKLMVE